MTRITRADRQQALYDLIRAYPPQTPLTLRGCAHALGREVTRTFNDDLAAVRQRALDDGCDITNCAWEDDHGGHVFRYLVKGRGGGFTLRAMQVRRKAILSQVAALERHAQYAARNEEDWIAKMYGGMLETASNACVNALRMLDDVDAQIASLQLKARQSA